MSEEISREEIAALLARGSEEITREPCEDAISRQAAIDAVEFGISYVTRYNTETGEVKVMFEESNEELKKAAKRIAELPPVTPQEPCSNCCNGNQIEKAKLCQKSYLAGMEHKQEPCEYAISRADAEALFRTARSKLNPSDYKTADEFNTRDLMLLNAEQMIHLLPSVTPQEPCEDAISRQSALDAIFNNAEEPADAYQAVRMLTPVNPQPKTGHWIANAPQYDMLNPQYICSECGNAHTRTTPYCEMCGAKMFEPQESEDKK